VNCIPADDIVVIESDGEGPVGYVRVWWEDLEDGTHDYVLFAPMRPAHIAEPLFAAVVGSAEDHLRIKAFGHEASRFRAFASHPGPGLDPTGEAAWLESLDYRPIRFEASLVRPDLEDIPNLSLPDGVEMRPVSPETVRPILEAHWEAFRGSWDFVEATEESLQQSLDDPLIDISLWKVAWVGDTVVGQVKSFINDDENETNGYLRGYTEVHLDARPVAQQGHRRSLCWRRVLRGVEVERDDRGRARRRHVEPRRRVPAVHEAGVRTAIVRSGLRQADRLNKPTGYGRDHVRRHHCATVPHRGGRRGARTISTADSI
jgi:hypothetical protein